MSPAHVTDPRPARPGPIPLPPSTRPRKPHERWTESQARTLVAVVRDLGIGGMALEEAEKGWAAVSKMFGRDVESCKAAASRDGSLQMASMALSDENKLCAAAASSDATDAMEVDDQPLGKPATSSAQPISCPPYTARNTEPWDACDVRTLLRAYDRSVHRHGTVHWADVVPLFPTRSKEACKAQVKGHKARARTRECGTSGFAPPPPVGVLDLDMPFTRGVVLDTRPLSEEPGRYLEAKEPRARQALSPVTNQVPPVQAPAKRKLSAEVVAMARRVLEEVTLVLDEDDQWHALKH